MAQHEDDWEQRPLDGSILYNINGGMPHGRVPIGNSAIKKGAVLAAAKSRNIRPSNSTSYRNVVRHNQELLQTQEVHRQMILMLFEKMGEQAPPEMLRRGTPTQAQQGTGLGTGSSHVGSQPDDGAVDGNVDVNDRDNCSGDIDGDNNHATIL